MNLLNPAPIVAAGRVEGPNGTRRALRITREAREPVEGLPETTAGEPSHSRGIVAHVERNLRLRYVFRDEMELLLTSAGFAVEALYGWFDGRPFDAQSSEMVWLVGKA
jgi:hypothetical protein